MFICHYKFNWKKTTEFKPQTRRLFVKKSRVTLIVVSQNQESGVQRLRAAPVKSATIVQRGWFALKHP